MFGYRNPTVWGLLLQSHKTHTLMKALRKGDTAAIKTHWSAVDSVGAHPLLCEHVLPSPPVVSCAVLFSHTVFIFKEAPSTESVGASIWEKAHEK